VKDFSEISEDNKLIITMEWIIEGIALIFIGILTIAIAFIYPINIISILVFILIVAVLNTLSLVSIFTGARINFLPFRLCPLVFSGATVLILLGLLF